MSRLSPRARLGALAAVALLVLGGAVYVLLVRGDGDAPVTEAGSRFGSEEARGSGGTLIDTLASVLSARVETRGGGADRIAVAEIQHEQRLRVRRRRAVPAARGELKVCVRARDGEEHV